MPRPAEDQSPTQPAWLGLRFVPGTTRVQQVIDNSPAAGAKFEAGDEIASLDGVAVHTSQEIVKTVTESRPGTNMTVALTRRGAPLTITVQLAKRPTEDKLISDTLLNKPAPAFTAAALDGKSLALADLRGHVVLIDFWATWCGPCETQIEHLKQWHSTYAPRGLQIVALSDEESDVVRKYVAEEHLTYQVGLDQDDHIRGTYLVQAMPTTVVIDKAGVVRYVSVGTVAPAEIEAVIKKLLK
ncbi:MAG TPA: redoxin domain-containing protein [Kofleriaceae bacterium]|nr:redoxin domain-containing protein [Kofleriaceae bacterium]